MPRTKASYDVFSAIGEPKRRIIIEHLIQKEMTVNELVAELSWSQPAVSKHLAVLRQVDLVSERRAGRFRFYRIQPRELKPIQEWIHQFEKYWGGSLDQLDTYLQELQLGMNNDKH